MNSPWWESLSGLEMAPAGGALYLSECSNSGKMPPRVVAGCSINCKLCKENAKQEELRGWLLDHAMK